MEDTEATQIPVTDGDVQEPEDTQEAVPEAEVTPVQVAAPAPQTQVTPTGMDGLTARNVVIDAGTKLEELIAHLTNNQNIHHDLSAAVEKLEEVRTMLATEINEAETIFGNPSVSNTKSENTTEPAGTTSA